MKNEVLIYLSRVLISLEVVVPKEHVGDFIVKFGEAFASRDEMEGGTFAKEVDRYFSHPNGWHVIVSVDMTLKAKLYKFIQDYSKEKNLSFKDADAT